MSFWGIYVNDFSKNNPNLTLRLDLCLKEHRILSYSYDPYEYVVIVKITSFSNVKYSNKYLYVLSYGNLCMFDKS